MDAIKALTELNASYGVLAIFAVMLLKEIGIPVPVPSDLIMIGAGVQIAAGAYSPLELLVALAVAVAVGGSIQFFLARTAGRAVVYRLAAVMGSARTSSTARSRVSRQADLARCSLGSMSLVRARR